MQKSHIFNPDNDLALGNGDPNYIAPASARRMAADLASLPVWWANEGDSLLIPHSSTVYYWQKYPLCSQLAPSINWITPVDPLPSQPLSPWGWNPALIRQLMRRGYSSERMPDEEQMNNLRRMSSREWAAGILHRIRVENTDLPLTGDAIPCRSETEVERAVKSLPRTLLKAPWSSSGKGLRKGFGNYLPPLSGWCVHTLRAQGCVMVEPFYDKLEDFAMEFHLSETTHRLNFIGYSLFNADENGAYNGNRLMSNRAIEEHLQQYLPPHTLTLLQKRLIHLLEPLLQESYSGYLGIDMMICRNATNEHEKPDFLLHPCVEINLRMNMGIVARLLTDRYLAAEHTGRFVIEYAHTPQQLHELHNQRTAAHPIQLNKEGKIESGYLCLTPPGKESCYAAWIEVYKSTLQ